MNNQKQALTREHRLIEAIKAWTGERLIGDDCAVLPGQTLVTSDSLVQGTHFLLPGIALADLGWKAVAVNLSDIAAMAGRPRYLTCSLTIPEFLSERDVEEMFLSMVDCARTYRTRIIGGDLTAGDILVISITALGETHESGCLLRSTARQGDVIVVSGDFGASAAGLWLMQNDIPGYPYCRQRHFRPTPRLENSWQLVEATGSRAALMDASDGLADALVQIARASAVGMEIDASLVPVEKETLAVAQLSAKDPFELALYGGEDYELVATLSKSAWGKLQASSGTAFRAIGQVTKASPGKVFVTGRGTDHNNELDLSRSFQHWL